ncbi:MAG: hypothetical protein VW879_01875 [Opitutae bacterium]
MKGKETLQKQIIKPQKNTVKDVLHELTADTNLADLTLSRLLDLHSPIRDKEKARKFGLDNWAELSDEGRKQWDWVFGVESRITRVKTTSRSMQRRIALTEDHHLGFYDETAGTL